MFSTIVSTGIWNPSTCKITFKIVGVCRYSGRGFWFEPPVVVFKNGQFSIRLPSDIKSPLEKPFYLNSSQDVFSLERDTKDPLRAIYRSYIDQALQTELDKGRIFGALMIEPVLLGAGGMQWVDPLFQRELIRAVREEGPISTQTGGPLPVIYDEIFVGMHRIGPASTASLLHVNPDISCFAKMLTGGLVPLAVTLASEEVFNEFQGDSKAEALLHGHSYTAHPVGCQVALKTLDLFDGIRGLDNGSLVFWNQELVKEISFLPRVENVVALGTVCAVHLKDSSSSYTSTSCSSKVAQRLNERHSLFVRPIGNVVYFMVSVNSPVTDTDKLLRSLLEEIKALPI
jgi:bifunctional dethiobiotin synthetase / adenosylmethionine---8-amino-7-oxononanoate aminotransferase